MTWQPPSQLIDSYEHAVRLVEGPKRARLERYSTEATDALLKLLDTVGEIIRDGTADP